MVRDTHVPGESVTLGSPVWHAPELGPTRSAAAPHRTPGVWVGALSCSHLVSMVHGPEEACLQPTHL